MKKLALLLILFSAPAWGQIYDDYTVQYNRGYDSGQMPSSASSYAYRQGILDSMDDEEVGMSEYFKQEENRNPEIDAVNSLQIDR